MKSLVATHHIIHLPYWEITRWNLSSATWYMISAKTLSVSFFQTKKLLCVCVFRSDFSKAVPDHLKFVQEKWVLDLVLRHEISLLIYFVEFWTHLPENHHPPPLLWTLVIFSVLFSRQLILFFWWFLLPSSNGKEESYTSM